MSDNIIIIPEKASGEGTESWLSLPSQIVGILGNEKVFTNYQFVEADHDPKIWKLTRTSVSNGSIVTPGVDSSASYEINSPTASTGSVDLSDNASQDARNRTCNAVLGTFMNPHDILSWYPSARENSILVYNDRSWVDLAIGPTLGICVAPRLPGALVPLLTPNTAIIVDIDHSETYKSESRDPLRPVHRDPYTDKDGNPLFPPVCEITTLSEAFESPKNTISITWRVLFDGGLRDPEKYPQYKNLTMDDMIFHGFIVKKYDKQQGREYYEKTPKYYEYFDFDDISCIPGKIGLDVNSLGLGLSSTSGDVYWQYDKAKKFWHFVIKKDSDQGLSKSGDVYWDNTKHKFVIKSDSFAIDLESRSGDVYWEQIGDTGKYHFVLKEDKLLGLDESTAGDVYWGKRNNTWQLYVDNTRDAIQQKLEYLLNLGDTDELVYWDSTDAQLALAGITKKELDVLYNFFKALKEMEGDLIVVEGLGEDGFIIRSFGYKAKIVEQVCAALTDLLDEQNNSIKDVYWNNSDKKFYLASGNGLEFDRSESGYLYWDKDKEKIVIKKSTANIEAGAGITIKDNKVSVNVDDKTIKINNNKLVGTAMTYSAGAGILIFDDGTIAVDYGTNMYTEGGKLCAKDTVYTAKDPIYISSDNVISLAKSALESNISIKGIPPIAVSQQGNSYTISVSTTKCD